ncbi:Late embryogenesis abundant protein, LEA_3 subgroup [Dillenia turbinata]|uniref:Late embryogenesis abundant protein, LEA_3 subgroup n=1 Tax=Dillenia turbinata TaxID=194707 RepID=A0AAN8VQ06_9MAGN
MASKAMIQASLRHTRRRSYSVSAMENMTTPAPMMGKASGLTSGGDAPLKETKTFWMRDPKTGNWIPESHFDVIDVVELRKKFLSKGGKR